MSYRRIIDPRAAAMTGYYGFGDVSSVADINPCELLPDTVACKQYQAMVEAKLTELYKGAGTQIVALAKQDPILAKALAGARSPTDVYNKAKQLSDLFSKNPLDQDAYRMYYSYARAGWDTLRSYASIDPRIQASAQFAEMGLTNLPTLTKWADRVALKGLDASAVVDGLDLGVRAMSAAKNLAAAFDGDIAKAISTATDYMAIAGGCVTMVAAGAAASGWGAVGGAIGCGVTLLTKVFSDIFGRASRPTPAQSAIFAPQKEQVQVIADDAQRLAAFLRYRYGVPAYEPYPKQLYVALGDAPDRVVQGFPSPGDTQSPIPAMGPYEIYLMTCLFSGISANELKEVSASGPSHPYFAYGSKPDLVDWGRYVFAPSLKTIQTQAYAPKGAIPYAYHSAYVRIWELISFFAAMSAVDKQSATDFMRTGLDVLPVRFLTAANFSATRWTELNDWFGGQLGRQLNEALDADQDEAWYIVGYLRLLAAFSYLNMQFWNGYTPQVTSDVPLFTHKRDMIADLDPATIPRIALRLPLNCRFEPGNITPLNTLKMQVRAAQSKLITIEESAKEQARRDTEVPQMQLFLDKAALDCQVQGNLWKDGKCIDASLLKSFSLQAAWKATDAGVVTYNKSSSVAATVGLAAVALLALKFLK